MHVACSWMEMLNSIGRARDGSKTENNSFSLFLESYRKRSRRYSKKKTNKQVYKSRTAMGNKEIPFTLVKEISCKAFGHQTLGRILIAHPIWFYFFRKKITTLLLKEIIGKQGWWSSNQQPHSWIPLSQGFWSPRLNLDLALARSTWASRGPVQDSFKLTAQDLAIDFFHTKSVVRNWYEKDDYFKDYQQSWLCKDENIIVILKCTRQERIPCQPKTESP